MAAHAVQNPDEQPDEMAVPSVQVPMRFRPLWWAKLPADFGADAPSDWPSVNGRADRSSDFRPDAVADALADALTVPITVAGANRSPVQLSDRTADVEANNSN